MKTNILPIVILILLLVVIGWMMSYIVRHGYEADREHEEDEKK